MKGKPAVGHSCDTRALLSPIENHAVATSYPLKASTSSDNPLCSTTGALLLLVVPVGFKALQTVAGQPQFAQGLHTISLLSRTRPELTDRR